MKRWIWISLWITTGGVAALLLAWWMKHDTPAVPLQGEVEMASVNLASKVPGRVKQVWVREGESVSRGTLLVELEGPELEAKLDQVQSKEAGAGALLRKVESGARSQEILAAKAQWEKAQAAHAYAQATHERMKTLHAQGVIPLQRLDEVETQLRAAAANETMAQSQLDLVTEGAREEDKAAAASQVAQAAGGVREVNSYLDETRVLAPFDGQVDDVVLRRGELAGSGTPIVVMVDPQDVWVVFQIPEDRLAGLTIGTEIHVDIPAIAGREIPMQISRIAVLPHFATWRATRASRGFDVRTFELRARFAQGAAPQGLRPGMSVLLLSPTLSESR